MNSQDGQTTYDVNAEVIILPGRLPNAAALNISMRAYPRHSTSYKIFKKLNINARFFTFFRAEYAASLGIDSVTHEGIVNEVQQQGKSQVPDHIKAEILADIRTILEKP